MVNNYNCVRIDPFYLKETQKNFSFVNRNILENKGFFKIKYPYQFF